MVVSAKGRDTPANGILAPLRYAVFRRIWTASLLSNLGLLIMGVGAAWSMTQMTSSADKVALVQTALMLPRGAAVDGGGSDRGHVRSATRGSGGSLDCTRRLGVPHASGVV